MHLTILLAIALQEPSLDQLVERLGSDDLDVRTAATAALRKAGAEAIAPLRKAAGDANRERAARAKELLEDVLWRVKGRIAYWAEGTKPHPHPMGTRAIWVVDPDDPKPVEVMRGIYCGYSEEIRWIPGTRRFLASVDIPREERFGLGTFPQLWRGEPGEAPVAVGGGESDFALSPDGKRVASVGGVNTICVDGKPITARFWKVWEPAWSPDGKTIVFRGGRTKDDRVVDGSWGMYRCAPDGTGLEKFCDFLSHAVFTPDGASLVAMEYTWPQQPKEIRVVDLATKAARVIGRGADFDDVPRLSPDGRRVAYARGGRVIVVGVDGKDETDAAAGRQVTWSPDNARLAYARDGAIHVLDLATKRETEVAKGRLPSWSR